MTGDFRELLLRYPVLCCGACNRAHATFSWGTGTVHSSFTPENEWRHPYAIYLLLRMIDKLAYRVHSSRCLIFDLSRTRGAQFKFREEDGATDVTHHECGIVGDR